jgi:hypothetical protein
MESRIPMVHVGKKEEVTTHNWRINENNLL